MIAAIATIGACLYRLRGSGFQLPLSLNRWAFPLAFALAMGLACRVIMVGDIVFEVKDTLFDATMAVLCLVSMKLVCGMGRDVSGFYGNPAKQQNNLFDDIDPNRFKDRPIERTAYSLAIQGVLGGLLVALPTHDLWPLVGGFMMAPIYYLGCYVLDHKYGKVKDGLAVSEYLFGAVFALSVTSPIWFIYTDGWYYA